jgi:hypothetical protein
MTRANGAFESNESRVAALKGMKSPQKKGRELAQGKTGGQVGQGSNLADMGQNQGKTGLKPG